MIQFKICMLFLGGLLFLDKCENDIYERKEYIWLENKSDHRVYVTTGIGEDNNGLNVFPDTILTIRKPFLKEVDGNQEAIIVSCPSLSSLFEQILVNQPLSVYVFDADQLDSLGWDDFVNANSTYNRYDMSLIQLQELQNRMVHQ